MTAIPDEEEIRKQAYTEGYARGCERTTKAFSDAVKQERERITNWIEDFLAGVNMEVYRKLRADPKWQALKEGK